MFAANAASASLHGGDQGAQTTHQGAQASSANAAPASQLQEDPAERIQIAQMEGVNARLQVMGFEFEMAEKDNEIALLKEYFGMD